MLFKTKMQPAKLISGAYLNGFPGFIIQNNVEIINLLLTI
jgi:hypothetical protein